MATSRALSPAGAVAALTIPRRRITPAPVTAAPVLTTNR